VKPILIGVFVVCGAVFAGERGDDAGRDALARYLGVDCELGERGAALGAVVRQRDAVEPRLIELLRSGPDAGLMLEVEASLAASWERRRAFLSRRRDDAFSPSDLDLVLDQSREEYLEAGRARFAAVFRERTIVALAALRSDGATAALTGYAEEADDEERAAVERALTYYSPWELDALREKLRTRGRGAARPPAQDGRP